MSKPLSPQCLGLVGGLGPAATIYFYNKILEAFTARKETPRIAISHADADYARDCVQSRALEKLATYLAEHIACTMEAGATFATMPAVAPFICAAELKTRSPLPVLDMIDSVNAAIAARGFKRVAIMGTRWVMESAFFNRLAGVEIVPFSTTDTTVVHDIYMGIVDTSRVAPADVERMREIGRAMVKRNGVDAIVLGGTELAVAFDETTAGFPALDCAAAHVGRIVETMRSAAPIR
jgi:aspartate racemase